MYFFFDSVHFSPVIIMAFINLSHSKCIMNMRDLLSSIIPVVSSISLNMVGVLIDVCMNEQKTPNVAVVKYAEFI